MNCLLGGRSCVTLQFKGCIVGLGIKIIGGISEEDDDDTDFGIFVKSVLLGGVAQLDGRLNEGDQILQVNGESLERVTNDHAVNCLRVASASDFTELVVCRDEIASDEYLNLLNNYSYSSASSVYDQSLSAPDNPPQGLQSELQLAYEIDRTPINSPVSELLAESEEEESMPSRRMRPNSSPPFQYQSHSDVAYGYDTRHYTRDDRFQAAPIFNSTPHINGLTQSFHHSPPDGASGNSHASYFDISPVTAADPNYRSHDSSSGHLPSGGSPVKQSSLTRKPTLDHYVKLPVEKLEVALHYLGLHPSEYQKAELRRRLRVDDAGMVSYGDFVNEARVMFRYELEQRGLTTGALYIAAQDVQAYTSGNTHTQYTVPSNARSLESDIHRIRQERNQLRLEISRLKSMLKEKERASNSVEEELIRVRKDAQGAIHENRSLRSKVQLSESAQRSARTMEHDYIEVVSLLEAEIAQVKATKVKQAESAASQKRVAVLNCQLRKADLSRKTYEVATEKLLQFAQLVHDRLSSRELLTTSSDPDTGRRRKSALHQLSAEAKDTVRSVKTLLESEPLPYGWEESFTADGDRYYVNHLTQMTSWQHPVSLIQLSADNPPPPSHHSSNSLAQYKHKNTENAPLTSREEIEGDDDTGGDFCTHKVHADYSHHSLPTRSMKLGEKLLTHAAPTTSQAKQKRSSTFSVRDRMSDLELKTEVGKQKSAYRSQETAFNSNKS